MFTFFGFERLSPPAIEQQDFLQRSVPAS